MLYTRSKHGVHRLACLLPLPSQLGYLSICPILYCWSYPLSSATLPSSSA